MPVHCTGIIDVGMFTCEQFERRQQTYDEP